MKADGAFARCKCMLCENRHRFRLITQRSPGMHAKRRVEALEGAVKKADGTFARYKCMQHENRCYEMDHPLQAKLVRGFQDWAKACCGRRL